MDPVFTQVLMFTIAGCGLGVITGLIPGIHINTVSVLILASLPVFARFSPMAVCAMLFAMAVTHTFLDFIPSILLGAPDSDSVLSVLPGHRMLMEGRALEAIKLTGLGSLVSLFITAIFFLLAIWFVPVAYSSVKPVLHFVLLMVVLLGFCFEKKPLLAVGVFVLAGGFGYLLLNASAFDNVMFPALSGLFGVSTMLLSIRSGASIPPQIKANANLGFRKILKNSFVGSISGMLVGLLPGVGAAQATYITQQVTRKATVKEFLIAVSGVNTSNIIFTLIVLYTIGKMRSGVVIAIDRVLSNLRFSDILIFLGVILIAGGIAMFLHLNIGTFLAKKLGNKDSATYNKISLGIIVLIAVLVAIMSGLPGLLILITGTAIGLIPPLIGVRRAECMGFLLLPVILFYSGLG